MKSKIDIIDALKQILSAKGANRLQHIMSFQEDVFNDENSDDGTFDEIISDLAYDLDFYEPNKEWRKEAQSYYDDGRLEDIIKLAIRKLEEILKNEY